MKRLLRLKYWSIFVCTLSFFWVFESFYKDGSKKRDESYFIFTKSFTVSSYQKRAEIFNLKASHFFFIDTNFSAVKGDAVSLKWGKIDEQKPAFLKMNLFHYDSKDSQITMKGDVFFFDESQKLSLKGQGFLWDDNTFILNSFSESDIVEIKVRELSLKGQGFLWDGKTHRLTFSHEVKGTMEENSESL